MNQFQLCKSFLFHTQANQPDRKRIAEIELPISNTAYERMVYIDVDIAQRIVQTLVYYVGM